MSSVEFKVGDRIKIYFSRLHPMIPDIITNVVDVNGSEIYFIKGLRCYVDKHLCRKVRVRKVVNYIEY